MTGALNDKSLRACARAFVGQHDFAGFAANRGHRWNGTVRTLRRVRVQRTSSSTTIEFDGDGFLYKMVRLMVGAIVRCGRKTSIEEVQASLLNGVPTKSRSSRRPMDSRSSGCAIKPPVRAVWRKKSARLSGRKIAVERADMLPVSTPAKTRIVSGKKRRFFRRRIEWLFSAELFHLKLLIGTAVGVLVTVVLAATSVIFTFRHQQRDVAARTHHRDDKAEVAWSRTTSRRSRMCIAAICLREMAFTCKTRPGFRIFSSSTARNWPNSSATSPEQRKRILKMREIVRNGIMTSSLSTFRTVPLAKRTRTSEIGAFNSPALEEAQDILQTINREEQIKLTEGARANRKGRFKEIPNP